MIKILFFLVSSLFLSVHSIAEIVEFSKCFKDKYDSFEDSNNKNSVLYKLEDHIITINFSTNTLTWTLRRSKETVSAMNKELKKINEESGKKSSFLFTKNTQKIFDLITYSGGVVTAKNLDDSEKTITDTTIYFDFEKKIYDKEIFTIIKKTKKIILNTEHSFICENSSTEVQEETVSNEDKA